MLAGDSDRAGSLPRAIFRIACSKIQEMMAGAERDKDRGG